MTTASDQEIGQPRVAKVKRTTRVVIDIEDAVPFELPVNVYGGSANGGKLGREAMQQWQRDNPETKRMPLEFIGGFSWRVTQVVVHYTNGRETAAHALSPSYPVDRLRDGVPRAHWPQWLVDLVDNAVENSKDG